MANFEEVGKSEMWEPKQKKEGDTVTKFQATDKSWVVGYYLESKYEQGKDKNSTVHIIQFDSVGDPSHLPAGVAKGDKVSLWGTGVLDNLIVDSVSPGQFVQITWKGIQQPKNPTGRPYHGWGVGVAKDVEPLKMGATFSADATPSNAEPAVAPEGAAPEEELDDLPF